MDAPDPLTGHSYLLHTPHDFEGTRGLTCVEKRSCYLRPNLPTVGLQASVTLCAVVRFTCLDLHKCAQRSPLIYPANRIRSDGRPRRILCYKMGSIDSGPWCWDATTQAASDDPPSQRRGGRGVLSFSFKVRVRQGRVTLPCESLGGVRVPNTTSPFRSVRPEYSMSIYTIYLPSRALNSRGKNHQRLLVHRGKTFLMSLDLSRARHLQVVSMKPFHLFLRVLHTFVWFPSIVVLRAPFPFYKIPNRFHCFIPSSNLSGVGNDLALHNPF